MTFSCMITFPTPIPVLPFPFPSARLFHGWTVCLSHFSLFSRRFTDRRETREYEEALALPWVDGGVSDFSLVTTNWRRVCDRERQTRLAMPPFLPFFCDYSIRPSTTECFEVGNVLSTCCIFRLIQRSCTIIIPIFSLHNPYRVGRARVHLFFKDLMY